MIDKETLTMWSMFNDYVFKEKTHQYFYKGLPVKTSVTKFVETFFEEFDREGVSAKYAKKHGMKQEDVLAMWDKKGKVSSTAGTMIHAYMENRCRGKDFELDFSEAIRLGIEDEVKERVEKLLPQAQAFFEDTFNKLIPLQLEYTVGVEDIIAGNIDMLCYNKFADEIQIWDYKNLKEMTTTNFYNKMAKHEFSKWKDCHLLHYSIQLTLYKIMLQRKLGIKIGKCYLVHFQTEGDTFEVYECLDIEYLCNKALDRFIQETRNS